MADAVDGLPHLLLLFWRDIRVRILASLCLWKGCETGHPLAIYGTVSLAVRLTSLPPERLRAAHSMHEHVLVA